MMILMFVLFAIPDPAATCQGWVENVMTSRAFAGILCVHSRNALNARFNSRAFSSSSPTPSSSSGPSSVSATNRGPFGWRALAIFLGVGTGGLAYYTLEKQRRVRGKFCSAAVVFSVWPAWAQRSTSDVAVLQ